VRTTGGGEDQMSDLSKVVLAVCLVGCAGSAPSLQSRGGAQPAVVTGEEACREPSALVLLCGERACAFYRCREVALPENAPRQAVPYDGAPGEDASVQAAPRAKVVLAFAGVAPILCHRICAPTPRNS